VNIDADDLPRRPPTDREVLDHLVGRVIDEQRRSRRWGIFFKLLLAGYVGATVLVVGVAGWQMRAAKSEDHAALIHVDGVIAANESANADRIISGLRAAFKQPHVKAVVLDINSPGGSPVQASMIYDAIGRLKMKKPKKQVVAVIEDTGASGAYYVASAADKIYANRSSIVGSIGVRLDSFGFTGTMKKFGVERRLYTAGSHKGILDPYLPRDPADESYIRSVLDQIHKQFIAAVKVGRGARLASDRDGNLFSGLFWTGEDAKRLGLIDGFGDRRHIIEDVLNLDTTIDYTPRRDLATRLLKTLGASLGTGLGTLFNGGPLIR